MNHELRYTTSSVWYQISFLRQHEVSPGLYQTSLVRLQTLPFAHPWFRPEHLLRRLLFQA
jgi:hypothetical protein